MRGALDEKSLEEAVRTLREDGGTLSPEYMEISSAGKKALMYVQTWYIDLFSPKGLGLLFPNLKGFNSVEE